MDAGGLRLTHNEYWNTIERASLWDVGVQRWVVISDERQVGHISSAVYSPRLERNIGIALLDVPYNEEGSRMQVETPEGLRDILITTMPFVDPDKKIPRASLRKS